MAGLKIRQHSAFSNRPSAKTKPKSKTNPRTNRNSPRKSRRRSRLHDAHDKVTTFPQVKGKVVREVRFSHDDPNNVLAIAFKDRTHLVFDINPEALILPLEVRANYFGESRRARKTWERLAAERK